MMSCRTFPSNYLVIIGYYLTTCYGGRRLESSWILYTTNHSVARLASFYIYKDILFHIVWLFTGHMTSEHAVTWPLVCVTWQYGISRDASVPPGFMATLWCVLYIHETSPAINHGKRNAECLDFLEYYPAKSGLMMLAKVKRKDKSQSHDTSSWVSWHVTSLIIPDCGMRGLSRGGLNSWNFRDNQLKLGGFANIFHGLSCHVTVNVWFTWLWYVYDVSWT